MFRRGQWVMLGGVVGVVAEITQNGYLVHLVDAKGETLMREAVGAERADPANGNPRTQVTDERLVQADDLTAATNKQIPASRRPLSHEQE